MLKKTSSFVAFCLIALALVSLARVSAMPIKAAVGQYLLNAAWEETLNTGDKNKPWADADFHLIGKLTVPRLNVSRVILSSASGEAMSWGVGSVIPFKSSSISSPIILAGHRDTHMEFMSKLQVGDRLEFQKYDGSTKFYKIITSKVTKTPQLALNDQTENNDKLILTTCWPFNAVQSGPERYVMIGVPLNI
jgi:sortase A